VANSDIDVCSQALTLLRADPISSFSDGTNEADICSQLYQDFIKNLFSTYPWTFATKKAQLNLETAAPLNEYLYSFIVPSEALLIWAVFDSAQNNVTPISDYDIYASDGTRRIYTNRSPLYADYTVYLDEANWPPYFTQFAVYALAAHLAMPVTHNVALAEYYNVKAYGSLTGNSKGGLFGQAMAIDSKQKRNEYIFSSPFTEARFS
jgi:hypothetical protein